MIAPSDAIVADVVEAVPGVWRVTADGVIVGYIIQAGDRFVSLYGSVYNTSVEIAQSRDHDLAVRRLLAY